MEGNRKEKGCLCKVYCAGITGIEAFKVTIEVYVTKGISFNLVGLPDSAVKESQQRIETSLSRFGFSMPGKKIVINMAPANIRKQGSGFDMAIAVGLLYAAGMVKKPAYQYKEISSEKNLEGSYEADHGFNEVLIDNFMIMGELSLDGIARYFDGALVIASCARKLGFCKCIFPVQAAMECSDINDVEIYGVETLRDVLNILENPSSEAALKLKCNSRRCNSIKLVEKEDEGYAENDFAFIKGQYVAKRALEIAAAGGHNVLLKGSPGCGKTMLAKSLTSILPPLDKEEAVTTGKIYSVAGLLKGCDGIPKERPFRAPHHTATISSLIGGGMKVMPGEVSLAHNGVLFLDEFPEFPRKAIEILRRPLEERFVQISRVKEKVIYPCSFILIAAMNPCPCGYYNSEAGKCSCSSSMISNYTARISGPILDRIDLHVDLKPVPFNDLISSKVEEKSSDIRKRVVRAREVQNERFKCYDGIFCNAQMGEVLIRRFVELDSDASAIMERAVKRLSLSARIYSRILKVARTIADLDGSLKVNTRHLSAAILFRGDNNSER